MIGRTLGRYRIVEKLGEGGMGEVYRAHDEQLKREVAVKILRADTPTDDHARSRFRKEAETLSKLNHPHIAQVYDFGSQDELDFLVMEEVPGESLKDKLAKGSLPEKQLVRLGTQIADALQEAHEQGIVHRDLKPGNVKLTAKGQAKVLDFGIAKLLQSGTEGTTQTFTETHALAGTLPYMAPEQLRGEGSDARSDLYSFGVMLYEMATGRRPFQEKVSTALSDAILHQPPPTPRLVSPHLSPELERIILKCLEKEPDSRYQSAKELAVDLRRLGAPTPALAAPGRRLRRPVLAVMAVLVVVVLAVATYFARQRFWPRATPPAGKVMLAVLPFDNLSGDPEQEYFSDGMTEEMIAQLGALHPARLGVIARTSAMRYKNTDKGIDEIGHELGVDYVLEGSVRREAEQLRITAQLIQVSDQTHLWAESYERKLAGVFAAQREVAEQIARSLEVELLPARQAVLSRGRTANPEAYEAYLKGRYYWNQRRKEGPKRGLQYFQEAVERDPDYALAYVGVADSYILLGGPIHSSSTTEEAASKARAAVMKALELDDTLGEAHTSLGMLYYGDWDWASAEKEFKRAIELNPGYPTAHQWYSILLVTLGRLEESIAELERARELDPLSLIINVNLGQDLYLARRYDEAIEQLQKTIELYPDFPASYRALADVYLQKGMYEEAIATLQTAADLGSDEAKVTVALAYTYGLAGQRQEALRLHDKLEELAKERSVQPTDMARVYVGLGDKDKAFEWLEAAYRTRDYWLTGLGVDPFYDPIRDDPRYHALLRRMNIPN